MNVHSNTFLKNAHSFSEINITFPEIYNNTGYNILKSNQFYLSGEGDKSSTPLIVKLANNINVESNTFDNNNCPYVKSENRFADALWLDSVIGGG